MLFQLDPEGGGDGIGGDVVVGRANAPGGDHIVIAVPQGVQGRNDLLHDVGDGPRLAEVHPMHAQILGDVAQIGVLGAPRQDLIADDQDSRRDHCRATGIAHHLLHHHQSL